MDMIGVHVGCLAPSPFFLKNYGCVYEIRTMLFFFVVVILNYVVNIFHFYALYEHWRHVT